MKINQTDDFADDEAGSIMLMVLMIIAVLTLVGIIASTNSTTEVRRAGDELVYHQDFYQAEGAAMQAVEELENIDNPKQNPPEWLEPVIGTIDESNINDFWENTAGTIPGLSVADPNNNTRYLVVPEGIFVGSSLNMSRSRVHTYTVYGRSENKRTAMIRIGYLKAF